MPNFLYFSPVFLATKTVSPLARFPLHSRVYFEKEEGGGDRGRISETAAGNRALIRVNTVPQSYQLTLAKRNQRYILPVLDLF